MMFQNYSHKRSNFLSRNESRLIFGPSGCVIAGIHFPYEMGWKYRTVIATPEQWKPLSLKTNVPLLMHLFTVDIVKTGFRAVSTKSRARNVTNALSEAEIQ